MHRFISRAFAGLGWLGFLVVVAWFAMFLADVEVGHTVSRPHRIATVPAIAIDLGLLLLFAVQHSVMARDSVKTRMRRYVPEHLERSAYVWTTNCCLAALLVLWQPWGSRIWEVHGSAALAVWALYFVGWSLTAEAVDAVDQFELLGLRQAGWGQPKPDTSRALKTTGLHAMVRHPLMLGLLLVVWTTPRMGADHLLLAAVLTCYILIGIRFEERDLRRTFGPDYDDYATRVPALIPDPRVIARRLGLCPGPRPTVTESNR